MVNPYIDEALLLQDIVDPIGNSLHDPAFLVRVLLPEVIHIDVCCLARRHPLSAIIFHVANLLSLLGINRHDGLLLELHLPRDTQRDSRRVCKEGKNVPP